MMTPTEEVHRLRTEAKTLRQENATLTRSTRVRDTRIDRDEQTIAELKERVRTLEGTVEDLTTENNNLKIQRGIVRYRYQYCC